ncbi:MAG: CotH kinase family protein [Clostridia bacterium]|nr:CotH kinase family protein [Clostridia bacterium]
MSTNKHFNKICIVAVVLALVLTVIFMNGEAVGIKKNESVVQYGKKLFDTSEVHTIDIVMNNWDSFIESCENEEYEICSVVIDGEAFRNVAIRAKGNTSLSMVRSTDSSRYSFKIEFDHYDSTNTYYGLDKLSLNNIIQDNTYMKDYLVYRMMREFGVAAPLCSFVNITVNGELWGVYLAVEAIEDSFLKRNYGSDYGELYKPDSTGFGGGRGNGKGFDMNAFINSENSTTEANGSENNTNSTAERFPEGFNKGDRFSQGERPQMPQNGIAPSRGQLPEGGEVVQKFPEGDRGIGNGMGSDDVKLKYIDDNASSYGNIFNNAKTDVSDADKARLISALKKLSENSDIEETVSVDEVIKYFVVHNYVCNGDSYTGSMIHNYYLRENDGILNMIPWDYNLSFGSFQSSDATSTVNSPIDSPVSGGATDDRPMVDWIFKSEEYTEKYHQYFSEFLSEINISGIIEETRALIAPYVKNDPSAFCTYEEFEKGSETLFEFCKLRSESVKGQLSGEIPSTTEAQKSETAKLIDASGISISDMGSMGHGAGNKGAFTRPDNQETENSGDTSENTTEMPSAFNPQQGGEMPFMPDGGMPPEMPEGMIPPQMPDGEAPSDKAGMWGNIQSADT